MSIASEIQKLIQNLASAYTACSSKGATIPSNQNFDNLSTCISSISSGGGAILDEQVQVNSYNEELSNVLSEDVQISSYDEEIVITDNN